MADGPKADIPQRHVRIGNALWGIFYDRDRLMPRGMPFGLIL